MGLYVQSLNNIPQSAHRDYYIYLLDYGWSEPLGNALMNNYEKMAQLAAENDAVVIRGTHRVHFEDEVLSWHHINGENAEDLLPAILITTDVISLVEKMFNDIKAHKDLKDFRVYKEMKKGLGHALADAIILEPNFGGIGFSFSKMINYFRKK